MTEGSVDQTKGLDRFLEPQETTLDFALTYSGLKKCFTGTEKITKKDPHGRCFVMRAFLIAIPYSLRRYSPRINIQFPS